VGFSIHPFLETKREGRVHSTAEIDAFVRALVAGQVSRPQAAAWLAFSFVRGLSQDEKVALTRAMVDSGDRMRWEGLEGPFVDKHSTGGVGDKVSLVLAPLLAELGRKVPMVSGRGLGHTGGTLDKLEAIPGFRTDLPAGRLREVLAEVGCFMNGQTGEIAPADRLLYALRNETCTVPSVALITASILSKKVAEGIDALMLDVKVGAGAFMKDLRAAQTLAESLVSTGEGCGVRTRALLTDMSQPLGRAVGNGLEVIESVETLKGGGPQDLFDLTVALADDERAAELLRSGRVYARFQRLVAAHGGDPEALERPERLCGITGMVEVRADRSGVVTALDAMDIALAAFALGAGREQAEQPVHPGVGLVLRKKRGDAVRAGEVLAEVHHAGRALEEAIGLTQRAFAVGEVAPEPIPLVLGRVG
jgi:pyrimidine-nucleoside phosphorylase/thymidine phosphorylase